MKTSAQALPKALATGLKPVYAIIGEEPLAAIEAADAVRAAARKAGYGERVPLYVEAGFHWAELAAEGASQSLFAEKRLLDLKILNGKPGIDGSRALVEYAKAPPPDTLLLVTVMNADYKSARSAWAKALAKAGVLVECEPIASGKMPSWVAARLRARGVSVPQGAAELIAEYAEGNPLAAAQTVERLTLLGADGKADMNAVREAVVDEARFGRFELANAASAGEATKALQILARERETGTPAPVILWELARELRLLEACAWAAENGGPRPNIYPLERRGPVMAAARRLGVRKCQALLAEAARVDRAIKGRDAETPDVLLVRLVLGIAGVDYARAA